MQVSLKWINELIDLKTIELNNLIEKITLGGFEVENVLTIKNNSVLDISSTANRSDSLSIQGISSEIATLLDQPLKISTYSREIVNWKEKVKNLTTTDFTENGCSTFVAFKIENLTNHQSPKWLKQKLANSDITPNNNLVDFKNYILLETGYPFEFYDYDKISSKLDNSKVNLCFRAAEKNQEFHASNDVKYKLDKSISVLKANELNIGIAGIIESNDFSYSKETVNLLVEGSVFNSSKIRQQARTLGTRTDRSARYEKSLKSTYLLESLYRLINLIRISNPHVICYFETGSRLNEDSKNTVILTYKAINEILGPIKSSVGSTSSNLSRENITNYLKRLNFEYSYNDLESSWDVKIPDFRSDDLVREIDIIEEIGRLHGFNNFLVTIPETNKIGKKDVSYKIRNKITQCFLNLGLSELINYSLVDDKTYSNKQIKLINPLVSDYSNLKTSLLPSLVKAFKENVRQGNTVIEGFEYSHIFLKDELKAFQETEYVAGLFGGNKAKLSWVDSKQNLNWFEAKGKIEQLFKQLNIKVIWKKSSCSTLNDLMHPYKSAEIHSSQGKKIGVFGQIHSIISKQLDISSEVYLFEFNIKIIQNEVQKSNISYYKEYSTYPKIFKDLSFIVNTNIAFEELKRALYFNGTQFLTEVKLLDEYKDKLIPDDSKSLCLQLVFQSKTKTLENKDIEIIIKNLSKVVTKKFNAKMRE